MKIVQTWSKGHTYTNPRPGQYLTHAHSHVTRVVAAMHSCFALTGAHQKMENPCFFFFVVGGGGLFEAGRHGRVQCQVTHLTTQTQDHNTERHKTVYYKIKCLRMCTITPKVAGVISPATPYKSTQQDEHLQHFRTS